MDETAFHDRREKQGSWWLISRAVSSLPRCSQPAPFVARHHQREKLLIIIYSCSMRAWRNASAPLEETAKETRLGGWVRARTPPGTVHLG